MFTLPMLKGEGIVKLCIAQMSHNNCLAVVYSDYIRNQT